MILVGALLSFDILVAIVLAFVYFSRQAQEWKDHKHAVASEPFVANAAFGTELQRQRVAVEKLNQQYIDLRQTVNDAALGQGLGRGNG